MDIKRAKQEIEHAVKAYLAVDDTGTPLIPPLRQRPILLMGPPGVGKTQIMEQIAQEVEQDGQRFRRKPVFNFMIRWLCPIFAAIILASSVANALGWIAM